MPLFHSIWCVWILYRHYPWTKKPIPSSGGQSYVVNNTNTIQQRVAPPIMRKTLQKNSPFPSLHGQTNISSELLNVSSWIGNTLKIEQTDFKIKKMLTYSSVAVQFDQFSCSKNMQEFNISPCKFPFASFTQTSKTVCWDGLLNCIRQKTCFPNWTQFTASSDCKQEYKSQSCYIRHTRYTW